MTSGKQKKDDRVNLYINNLIALNFGPGHLHQFCIFTYCSFHRMYLSLFLFPCHLVQVIIHILYVTLHAFDIGEKWDKRAKF